MVSSVSRRPMVSRGAHHGSSHETPREFLRKLPRNPTVCHEVAGDPGGTIGLAHRKPWVAIGLPTGARASPMGSRESPMGSRGFSRESPMGSPGFSQESVGSRGKYRTIMSIACSITPLRKKWSSPIDVIFEEMSCPIFFLCFLGFFPVFFSSCFFFKTGTLKRIVIDFLRSVLNFLISKRFGFPFFSCLGRVSFFPCFFSKIERKFGKQYLDKNGPKYLSVQIV